MGFAFSAKKYIEIRRPNYFVEFLNFHEKIAPSKCFFSVLQQPVTGRENGLRNPLNASSCIFFPTGYDGRLEFANISSIFIN